MRKSDKQQRASPKREKHLRVREAEEIYTIRKLGDASRIAKNRPAISMPQVRQQRELGQFLTPEPIAEFMASMFEPLPKTLRLLDAGAGAGALTSALVRRLCDELGGTKVIRATLYEIDPSILDSLSATMRGCQNRCLRAGIQFTFTIHSTDFIGEMAACLAGDLFGKDPPAFDVAIANPPYRKIHSNSPARRALSSVGLETTNLYAGFIALIQRLLTQGGQIVAITPRSFCNGPYFQPFREELLSNLQLRRIHTFESRKAAFRADSVLQENIIFHAVKSPSQSREVVISSSNGENGSSVSESRVRYSEVVHTGDAQKFIHIPSTNSHTTAKETISDLKANLAALGLTISTGPVVDFRLRHALRKEPQSGTVPLIYPSHFSGGTVQWPNLTGRKPNAIVDDDTTRPWLIPSGVYLLTKRFTSKEERRRVVACILDPEKIKAKRLGLENHLNYFHSKGQGLGRKLAIGLYAFLNSTVVDQYFRSFSGHTQVNATDLRQLRYPDRATLEAIAGEIETLDISQAEIDGLVDRHIHGRQ